MTQRTPHRLGVGLLTLRGAIQLAACDNNPVSPEERVATLEITELPSLLVPGDTLQLEAVALDAAGSLVQGATISWTSSDLAVATVSSTGPGDRGCRGHVYDHRGGPDRLGHCAARGDPGHDVVRRYVRMDLGAPPLTRRRFPPTRIFPASSAGPMGTALRSGPRGPSRRTGSSRWPSLAARLLSTLRSKRRSWPVQAMACSREVGFLPPRGACN